MENRLWSSCTLAPLFWLICFVFGNFHLGQFTRLARGECCRLSCWRRRSTWRSQRSMCWRTAPWRQLWVTGWPGLWRKAFHLADQWQCEESKDLALPRWEDVGSPWVSSFPAGHDLYTRTSRTSPEWRNPRQLGRSQHGALRWLWQVWVRQDHRVSVRLAKQESVHIQMFIASVHLSNVCSILDSCFKCWSQFVCIFQMIVQ